MNRADSDMLSAERQADEEFFSASDSHARRQHAPPDTSQQAGNALEEAERPRSRASSVSTVQPHLPGARSRGHSASRLPTNTSAVEMAFMEYIDRHPTARKRMHARRLQHSQTVGSTKDTRVIDLPGFGDDKPYPPLLPEREEYVVGFDGEDDPRFGMNWPLKKKLRVSAVLVFDSIAATFASSVFSAAGKFVGEEFHKGPEVVTLGTSLFVLGYVFGPIFFAPLSELFGRRPPVFIAAFAFGVFNIGVAVAKDYQTIMICRFFAGLFGSCPLTLCAAIFADIYNDEWRGLAVCVFAACVICGPMLGPPLGGFIGKSYLGWRWTAYIPAFMGFASSIAALLFQEESYAPVILVSKAAELRRLTRNWGIHAKQEEVELDIKELMVKNISRPIRILFTEPIVLFVTIYVSFLYGLLYLNLTAYSIVFGKIYGWSPGVAGLPFFGMIIGVFIGLALIAIDVPRYAKKLRANEHVGVPEWRLPITMVGGIVFAIGLFWFGWTGFTSDIPWIVPTLAGLFLGFGIFTCFLQCLNYLIDSYIDFAASVIAANTIMRSMFGAIFPLFASYMYEGIHIQWGQTFLGCVAVLFIPMPFLFYRYGAKIRAKSKLGNAADIELKQRRDLEAAGLSDGSSNAGVREKEIGKEV